MKKIYSYLPYLFLLALATYYIYPIFSGLILLPLDLLVTHSNPWNMAGTILLKNPYMQDSIIQMFPWKHLTYESLTGGILPLWNPYQFMGTPFMASMKPLVFYPFNLLFIFGEVAAWNGLLWSQLALSLIFTYLFLRSLEIKVSAAVLAAISFGFNSLMITVLEFGSEGHVLMWMPLLLYSVKKYADTGWVRYLVFITGATIMSLLAGHLQYFAYAALLHLSFSFYELKVIRNNVRGFIHIVLFTLIGVGISAFQIIPGFELFSQSYRGIADNYQIFSGGLLGPTQLLRLLSPDWFGNPVTRDLVGGYIESAGYIGIIPLFFALYSLFVLKTQKYVKFFTGVLCISMLLSMHGIGDLLYYLKIPAITSGSGGRLFILSLFSLSVLGSFGLAEFLKTNNSRRNTLYTIVFTVSVLLIFAIGLVLRNNGVTEWVNIQNIKIQLVSTLAVGMLSLLYITFHKRSKYIPLMFVFLLLVITYGDLYRMGYRFLTFSNTKFLYPELEVTKFVQRDSLKSLGRVYGLTEPEVHGVLKVYSTETYNPLYPLRTAKLIQALENNQDSPLPVNKFYLTKNERMKYVIDFLGVEYIVPGKGQNPATEYWNNSKYQNELTKIYEDERNDVYRNTAAYPRYKLFYSAVDGLSDSAILTHIQNRSIDFRSTVLLSEQVPLMPEIGTGSAELIRSDMNSLVFKISSTAPAIFYISDTYFPGWHASVKGIETQIYRANYNFRAVPVPAGESELIMWYMPKSFIIGLRFSVVSSILFVLFLIGIKAIEKIKSKEIIYGSK